MIKPYFRLFTVILLSLSIFSCVPAPEGKKKKDGEETDQQKIAKSFANFISQCKDGDLNSCSINKVAGIKDLKLAKKVAIFIGVAGEELYLSPLIKTLCLPKDAVCTIFVASKKLERELNLSGRLLHAKIVQLDLANPNAPDLTPEDLRSLWDDNSFGQFNISIEEKLENLLNQYKPDILLTFHPNQKLTCLPQTRAISSLILDAAKYAQIKESDILLLASQKLSSFSLNGEVSHIQFRPLDNHSNIISFDSSKFIKGRKSETPWSTLTNISKLYSGNFTTAFAKNMNSTRKKYQKIYLQRYDQFTEGIENNISCDNIRSTSNLQREVANKRLSPPSTSILKAQRATEIARQKSISAAKKKANDSLISKERASELARQESISTAKNKANDTFIKEQKANASALAAQKKAIAASKKKTQAAEIAAKKKAIALAAKRKADAAAVALAAKRKSTAAAVALAAKKKADAAAVTLAAKRKADAVAVALAAKRKADAAAVALAAKKKAAAAAVALEAKKKADATAASKALEALKAKAAIDAAALAAEIAARPRVIRNLMVCNRETGCVQVPVSQGATPAEIDAEIAKARKAKALQGRCSPSNVAIAKSNVTTSHFNSIGVSNYTERYWKAEKLKWQKEVAYCQNL